MGLLERKNFEERVGPELQAKIDALKEGGYPPEYTGNDLKPDLIGEHLERLVDQITRLMNSNKDELLELFESHDPSPLEAGPNYKHRYRAGDLLLQTLLDDPKARVYQPWQQYAHLFPNATVRKVPVGRLIFAEVTIPTRVINTGVVYNHQDNGLNTTGRIVRESIAMYPSLVGVKIKTGSLS